MSSVNSYYNILIFKVHFVLHLSKGINELKQDATQVKMSFSGSVFHGLANSVVCFVASDRFDGLKFFNSDAFISIVSEANDCHRMDHSM